MSEEMYLKLAKVLDTLPNGFPTTESGVEIKLLKRIFRPEDTELFCDLKLNSEDPKSFRYHLHFCTEGRFVIFYNSVSFQEGVSNSLKHHSLM